MLDTYTHDKTFDRINLLTKGDYEKCIFNSRDFANTNLVNVNL